MGQGREGGVTLEPLGVQSTGSHTARMTLLFRENKRGHQLFYFSLKCHFLFYFLNEQTVKLTLLWVYSSLDFDAGIDLSNHHRNAERLHHPKKVPHALPL